MTSGDYIRILPRPNFHGNRVQVNTKILTAVEAKYLSFTAVTRVQELKTADLFRKDVNILRPKSIN